MNTFLLNGQHYSQEQILAGHWDTEDGYAQKVLTFARQWLSGETDFALSTSGSTGVPKTIHIQRQQMEYSARQTARALQLEEDDWALACLNIEFIAGKMMLVRAFVNHLNLVVVPPSSNPFSVLPADIRVDFTALVPLQLEHILANHPEDVPRLESMKAILVGGAPVGPELSRTVSATRLKVYITYGMTETVSHVALKKIEGDMPDAPFIALEGVTLGQDERGCLTIQSPVTLGETIITNDFVHITAPDSFQWLGRADFIINTGGIKVVPEMCEAKASRAFALLSLKRRFIFCGLPDHKLGEKVVLLIEGPQLDSQVSDQLKHQLEAVLSRYEQPKNLLFIPWFPETSSGKLDRTTLKKMASTL